MTTPGSGIRSQTSACNGVTTAFAVGFKFIANEDLRVYLHGAAAFDLDAATLLTEGVHYTVSGSGPAQTAVVNTVATYAGGNWITRYRLTSTEQSAQYPPSGPFPSAMHETQLDRLSLVDEENAAATADLAARALRVPVGETAPALPAVADRAGTYFGWDAEGNPVASSGTGNDAALRADLAAAAGASLVAFTPTADDAVSRSLQSLLRARPLTPEDFGAAGDGATDDSDALVALGAAITAAGGGAIELRPGATYLTGRQTPAGATGLGYSYLATGAISISNCARGVRIVGNGARIKVASGLRYGSFDPVTGAAHNPALPFLDADYRAQGVSAFVLTGNSGGVHISDIEIDGNVDGYVLGGLWGDQGRQISAYGVLAYGNASLTVDDAHIHHFPLDGVGIGWPGMTVATAPKPHRLIGVRSLYNGRQALSWVGGNSLTCEDCDFSHTGRNAAGVSTSPGAGVDVEAESAVCRNAVFINCRMIHNAGVGFIADSGDGADIRLVKCKIVGTTVYSIWPRKPGIMFDDCEIYGQGANPFSSTVPKEATRFRGCRFSMKLAESPTGALYNSNSYLLDFGGGDTGVMLEDCAFDTGGAAAALLPFTNNVTYSNCTFKQNLAAAATLNATMWLGVNRVFCTVDPAVNGVRYGPVILQVAGTQYPTGIGVAAADHADDAAAAAGGIGLGQVYRTGSALKVRVA